MLTLSFAQWFAQLTDHPAPLSWQTALAEEVECHSRTIRIPTGLGKTEGVLAVWSYQRLHQQNPTWPRRLVWCLPMRVLVEQTRAVAERLTQTIPEPQRPRVHVAMGGEDSGDWFLYPECPAIIIGTQDMLLSRALNRGFASSRAKWPSEFGLLQHDCLWVLDEVQLMDVGLATASQLQAFRDDDAAKHLRPCATWWMSATLQPSWLRTVDTAPHHAEWTTAPCTVPAAQRQGGLWDSTKSLHTEAIAATDDATFAKRIVTQHNQLEVSAYGRITLVVCNTVQRACATAAALPKAGFAGDIRLVHSRFRPYDRRDWREQFLTREACTTAIERIIVATQVIEAGVDISAGCLVTELAPWPSLVQRFGRCARYGGQGIVLVVDRGADERAARPYAAEELRSAWEALQRLTAGVGITALEAFEEKLDASFLQRLYPYVPAHLLLRHEFDELFDTTPDLTGADLDISRFIRADDERDLQVFWAVLPPDKQGEPPVRPDAKIQPHRDELCNVPFLLARDWLCGPETKTNKKPRLRKGMRAWVWDWLDGEWVPVTRAALLPGRVVCVAAACGGYHNERGFDSEATAPVEPVPLLPRSRFTKIETQQNGEPLSYESWQTIAHHTAEVVKELQTILGSLGLPPELNDQLEHAARWHDWGKVHPAFQGAMRNPKSGLPRPDRIDLAKAPEGAWRKPPAKMYRDIHTQEVRPSLRHELASALGLFALMRRYQPTHPALLGPWLDLLTHQGKPIPTADTNPPPLVQRLLQCTPDEFDLLVYLVASHHGKVRVGLHATPSDQDYHDADGRGLPIRGIREQDHLPEVVLVAGEAPVPETSLSLTPAALGLSPQTGRSWQERSLGLLDRYGPALLAYLEALLRAADVRASQANTPDPILKAEGQP